MKRSNLQARKRWASILAAAAFLAAAIALTPHAGAQQQPPIKFGALVAATGPLAFVGDPEAKTLKMLAEAATKAGGVIGRPVQVIVYDTGADARQATTFARRLIEDDKVDLIVGPSSTGETMAVVPIAEEAKVPLISLGAGNVIVEPVKPWVFKTAHSYRQAVERIFADMKQRGIKTVGLIAGSGGADQDCRGEARKAAPAYGLRIVSDETHAPTDTDVTPQLTKIRSSAAEAVLGCNTGSTSVITTRNYRQLGMSAPLYFQHGSGSRQFIEQAGAAAEGVRVPVPAVLLVGQLAADDPQRPVVARYQEALQAAFGEAPSGFGAYAHDALLIGLEAIKRSGGTDKAKIREQIEKIKEFAGAGGIFNMSAADHMGLDIRSLKMAEIKGGNFVLLK